MSTFFVQVWSGKVVFLLLIFWKKVNFGFSFYRRRPTKRSHQNPSNQNEQWLIVADSLLENRQLIRNWKLCSPIEIILAGSVCWKWLGWFFSFSSQQFTALALLKQPTAKMTIAQLVIIIWIQKKAERLQTDETIIAQKGLNQSCSDHKGYCNSTTLFQSRILE